MAAVDQPAPPFVCTVVREESGGHVLLRGRLVSREDVRGTYSFRITRSGPSGTSAVSQGGPFVSHANTETYVGSAQFNADPRAQLHAELTLRVDSRTYQCGSQPSEGGQ
ncbi:MAG TPA: curli-like amyloid fiber formation chaperone CsgH [Xanthobacteraceae bacterium]|nr:curli-like amyloid fiber formation chaperone CsgH [Xanthobacteraceae bacterium]